MSEPGPMTERALEERFTRLWQRLGGAGDGRRAYQALRRAYGEPHRSYHGVDHLRDCLAQLDMVAADRADRDLAEAALWFHDAVYHPGAPDNEARSADLATVTLRDGGVPEQRVAEIVRLVRLTDHARAPEDDTGALVCDIDLSILGRPPADYAEYERRIRMEYHRVPEPAFRIGRTKVLARLLDRDPLYHTASLRERYEEPARQNLAQAMRGVFWDAECR